MLGIRYEEYSLSNNSLPFILNADIQKTPHNLSTEKNWHEDLEIQLCTNGQGSVLLNGKNYSFVKNNIAVIGPNAIHYTTTADSLTYTCLIISPSFFKSMGINTYDFRFQTVIMDTELEKMLLRLTEIYKSDSKLKTAKLNQALLNIVITLIESYSTESDSEVVEDQSFLKIKAVIKYIRRNYNKKITLAELAQHSCTDKYALCRIFKKTTGLTITNYINRYRCQIAADLISQGQLIGEAALSCGFENLSFFTKTFKKYIGVLPSVYKVKIPPKP